MKKGYYVAFITIFLTLLLDQWLKVYIKLNFTYNEEVSVFGDWFRLVFVENPGMAFGWKIPFLSDYAAKMLLSSFRLVAVAMIAYYLVGLVKRKTPYGLIFSIALIFAGALGNIIDSAFYGLIFSESPRWEDITAQTVPFGSGYADFLTGKVVDMLKFDLFTIELPGGGYFNFFAPIFNIADVAISVGVAIILLFQRKSFQSEFFPKKTDVLPESENDSEFTKESEEEIIEKA